MTELSSGAPCKIVACPTCCGDSVFAPSNIYRPFCSHRCQQIDLGAWASEQFVMPSALSAEPIESAPEAKIISRGL